MALVQAAEAMPSRHRGSHGRAREALLGCDLLVAVSPSVRDTRGSARRPRRAHPHRRSGVRPALQRAGIPRRPGEMQVLCVAQWIRRKGIVELLHAWGRGIRPAPDSSW